MDDIIDLFDDCPIFGAIFTLLVIIALVGTIVILAMSESTEYVSNISLVQTTIDETTKGDDGKFWIKVVKTNNINATGDNLYAEVDENYFNKAKKDDVVFVTVYDSKVKTKYPIFGTSWNDNSYVAGLYESLDEAGWIDSDEIVRTVIAKKKETKTGKYYFVLKYEELFEILYEVDKEQYDKHNESDIIIANVNIKGTTENELYRIKEIL